MKKNFILEEKSTRLQAKASQALPAVIDRGNGKRLIKRKVYEDFEEDLNKAIASERPRAVATKVKNTRRTNAKIAAPSDSAAKPVRLSPFVESLLAKKKANMTLKANASSAGEHEPMDIDDNDKAAELAAQEEENNFLEEFHIGEVVWAKSAKNGGFWPARIADPIYEVPPNVRSEALPCSLCVVFLGPPLSKSSGKGKVVIKDYGWMKRGMLHHYQEGWTMFMNQTFPPEVLEIYEKACEEAELLEGGMEIDTPVKEGELSLPLQDPLVIPPDAVLCHGCGFVVEGKKAEQKVSTEEGEVKSRFPENTCVPCSKLYESDQYCPVCVKVWLFNEPGDWVQCDTCKLWVHLHCANISAKEYEDIKNGKDVFDCSACKCKRTSSSGFTMSTIKTENHLKSDGTPREMVREKVNITSEGKVAGVYLPRQHMVVCQCRDCTGKDVLFTPSAFEKHSGSRRKKWKESLRLVDEADKACGLFLVDWLYQVIREEFMGIGWLMETESKAENKKNGNLAMKMSMLASPYEPIRAQWTSEFCAVCFHPYDQTENRLMFCIKCQIGVHEGCYGVRMAEVGDKWICRSCESPDPARECCLCPVRGGAMKQTTVEGLWAHISCAWFIPEVYFTDTVNMEPIEGVEKVGLERIGLNCTVCQQPHGACIQCSAKCHQSFHATCALKAGYKFELTENKKGIFTKRHFCPGHKKREEGLLHEAEAFLTAVKDARNRYISSGGKIRGIQDRHLAPKLDIIREEPEEEEKETRKGNKRLRQATDLKDEKEIAEEEEKDKEAGVGEIGNGTENGVEEDLQNGGDEITVRAPKREKIAAARCRNYDREKHQKKKKAKLVPFVIGGPRVHSPVEIAQLQQRDPAPEFKSLQEKLTYLRNTDYIRLTIGKSAIHNFGLIAKQNFSKGEMLFEYNGMIIPHDVANLREMEYDRIGKDNYLFTVDDDLVIDSTDIGTIGRFINHSCDPNCYSKVLDTEAFINDQKVIENHIVFFARKDIKIGEELTFNYLFSKESTNKLPCKCKSRNCTGYLN